MSGLRERTALQFVQLRVKNMLLITQCAIINSQTVLCIPQTKCPERGNSSLQKQLAFVVHLSVLLTRIHHSGQNPVWLKDHV